MQIAVLLRGTAHIQDMGLHARGRAIADPAFSLINGSVLIVVY